MPHLLRIDSSSRHEGSHSRGLGDHAEALWRKQHPGARVTQRDVTDGSIPLIGQDTIVGFFTPPDQRDAEMRRATALSDQLVSELHKAELLLITAPIYNFSVPAALKAWIDQVVRIGETFAYEDGAFTGLARTRRALVVCAYGAEGYLEGEAFAEANFLDPYLRFVLRFIGISQVDVVSIQGTTGTNIDAMVARLEKARDDIAELLEEKEPNQ